MLHSWMYEKYPSIILRFVLWVNKRARESGGIWKKRGLFYGPFGFRCKIISELSLGLIIIFVPSAIRSRCHCCGEQHQCSRSNSNNKDEAEQCIHFCLLYLYLGWLKVIFLIHTAILSSQCKISKTRRAAEIAPAAIRMILMIMTFAPDLWSS